MKVLVFPKPELSTLKVVQDFLRILSKKMNSNIEVALSKFAESETTGLGLSRDNDGDLVIVFGGDGTFIRACRYHPNTPVVGVNTGMFGFLCEFEEDDLENLATLLSSSDSPFTLQTVVRLDISTDNTHFEAINDVAISYASYGKPGVFSIYVDQKRLYTAKADGVVISTPIGSSAYNLAVGGPLVAHELPVFIISPIAPFLSFSHPLVVSSFSHVVFVNEDRQHKAGIMIDGNHVLDVAAGEEISIRPSKQFTHIALFKSKFLTRVHEKIDPGFLNLSVRQRKAKFEFL